MEAVPKSDIKSVIKSDIRFDISIKQPTWIGHKSKRDNSRKPEQKKDLHIMIYVSSSFKKT